jgi:hypothetical protein
MASAGHAAASQTVKKPAIFDGLSLGRKTPRESQRLQTTSIHPSVLWQFTHSRALELGEHPRTSGTWRDPAAVRSVVGFAEGRRQHVVDTIEKLITNSIHTAFIKYPEGDGDANMDYDWISSEQSSRITKAILLDLAANGFEIVKKGVA